MRSFSLIHIINVIGQWCFIHDNGRKYQWNCCQSQMHQKTKVVYLLNELQHRQNVKVEVT